MTIGSIHACSKDFQVLGSLEENERLLTNGRKFSKLKAPDRFLKDADHPILKLLHKIITFVLKIFQMLRRELGEESAEINLHDVEELTREISEALGEELPNKSDDNFYKVLRDLGHLSHSIDRCVGKSLNAYKQTLLSRNPCLDTVCTIDEALRADRVGTIATTLTDEVIPQLEQAIDLLENQVYEEDFQRSEIFLDRLYSRAPVHLNFRISAKAYLEVLERKFGESAVDRAVEYYGLEHELTLTGTDAAALTIGVVANLTEEDLRYQMPDFDTASEEGLCRKLIEVRAKVDYGCVRPGKSMRYKRQLQHDQMLLQYVNEIEDWRSQTDQISVKGLKHYSYSEYLARHVTYALFNKHKTRFPEGILIPMYDEHNGLRLMTAHQLISVKGLYGAIFKPLRPSDDYNKLHVVFRGTFCKYSILRDISPTERMHNRLFDGPGRYSYTKHEEEIYGKIRDHVLSMPNATVEFDGHSLGASDAMRAMEYFMHQQTLETDRLPIAKYILNAFNTPGIEPDVTRRFMSSLRSLEVETDLRYFDVHHDFIQELGSTRLGYWRSDEECPEFLRISFFKFNRRIEERIIALARNFFKRWKFNLQKALEAHTFYCLRLHDTDQADRLNSTFIQDVYTNHPEDVGVVYGKGMDRVSALSTNEQISSELLTASCRFGRKIKRTGQKVARVFKRFVPPFPNELRYRDV